MMIFPIENMIDERWILMYRVIRDHDFIEWWWEDTFVSEVKIVDTEEGLMRGHAKVFQPASLIGEVRVVVVFDQTLTYIDHWFVKEDGEVFRGLQLSELCWKKLLYSLGIAYRYKVSYTELPYVLTFYGNGLLPRTEYLIRLLSINDSQDYYSSKVIFREGKSNLVHGYLGYDLVCIYDIGELRFKELFDLDERDAFRLSEHLKPLMTQSVKDELALEYVLHMEFINSIID